MPFLQAQQQTMVVTHTTTLLRGVEATEASPTEIPDGHFEEPDIPIPHIDLSYDNDNSELSARNLVYRIRPKWREVSDELELTKFTDGITNTLLRITRRRPGASQDEVDVESILMRAYGNNTDLIIDRDREARSHALLAKRGMAPPLLARFDNGLLYKYIPGKVCTPDDLTKEPVWRGVARKLAEWHARVPISSVSSEVVAASSCADDNVNGGAKPHSNGHTNGRDTKRASHDKILRPLERRSPEPNVWSVLQKWVDTLPVATEKERARRELLQNELERTFQELDSKNGIGENGFVFGHLDLLSANVIMLPMKPNAAMDSPESLPITFIDYEYATPCPVAMDIANHFAEWAGYDLDYNRLPTKSVRHAFLTEYVTAYNQYAAVKVDESEVISYLEAEVDRWRGIPGLWWGIWALIQAKISEIDFDYASYAEERLEEYWAWRAESSGARAERGKPMPLREQRWAQTS